MEDEKIVIGWKNIAKYTPYDATTLQLKYGKIMKENGVVFRSHITNAKRPVVWSWPSQIKRFVIMVSESGEF